MNLFDSLRRTFQPSYNSQFTYYTPLSVSTKNVFTNGFRNNVAINICSAALADKVAINPINIYKIVKVGEGNFKEVVKDDPRYRILHYEPNGYTSAYTFWHTMELNKHLYGNSYAIIHKFSETNTIALELIHPTSLVGLPSFDKGILKYTFSTGTGNITYNSNQIIHFKRESIDGVMGRDPYEVLHEEVKRTYLANKTITNYYENDGKSTKVLKTTATVGDLAKLGKAVNKFRKETGGSYYDDSNKLVKGNLDNMVSYPEMPGNSEVQELGNDQNHDLYNSVIQDCNLKIAAYYRIPPHVLNILQAQKDSNVETLQLDFNVSTVQYSLRSNRQELEMKLLTTEERDKGYSIEYNTMAVVELDHEVRMKGYESLSKTAFMTPNEVRELEGMRPIKGGDQHYIFNQFSTLEGLSKDSSMN